MWSRMWGNEHSAWHAGIAKLNMILVMIYWLFKIFYFKDIMYFVISLQLCIIWGLQSWLFIIMWSSHTFKLLCIKISGGSWTKALWVNRTRIHRVTEITFRKEHYIHFNRHYYATQNKILREFSVYLLLSFYAWSLSSVAKDSPLSRSTVILETETSISCIEVRLLSMACLGCFWILYVCLFHN